MLTSWANALVYIFSNSRLILKKKEPAKFAEMVGKVEFSEDELPSDDDYQSGSTTDEDEVPQTHLQMGPRRGIKVGR